MSFSFDIICRLQNEFVCFHVVCCIFFYVLIFYVTALQLLGILLAKILWSQIEDQKARWGG